MALHTPTQIGSRTSRLLSTAPGAQCQRAEGYGYERDSKCQWPEVRGHSWLSMSDVTNGSRCSSAPTMDGHRDIGEGSCKTIVHEPA